MKLILTALLVLSSNAQAAENFVYKAELKRFQIDEHALFGHKALSGGEALVDLKKNQVRVTLYRKWSCPPGALCTMVMPPPVILDLPIYSRSKDKCNTGIVKARTREAIPGGIVEHLEVRDNSRNSCPHFVALSPTEVIYTTSQALPPRTAGAKTRSVFEGERLEKLSR